MTAWLFSSETPQATHNTQMKMIRKVAQIIKSMAGLYFQFALRNNFIERTILFHLGAFPTI